MRHARGFTLLEVMVALVVLAIGLGGAISRMGSYANNAGYLKEKTVALWVAHNRLTEIEVAPAWPDLGKSDGEAEMAGGKWKWYVEVVKAPDDDKLRRIDIRVQRKDGDEDLAQLTGFISSTGRQ